MFERITHGFRQLARTIVGAHGTGEEGQSTTEYTLVILVAATIALLLLNWAKGGAVTAFFDNIFSKVTGLFS